MSYHGGMGVVGVVVRLAAAIAVGLLASGDRPDVPRAKIATGVIRPASVPGVPDWVIERVDHGPQPLPMPRPAGYRTHLERAVTFELANEGWSTWKPGGGGEVQLRAYWCGDRLCPQQDDAR